MSAMPEDARDPAPRNTSAITDHNQAETVPTVTSVSMVTARWRRFIHVAR